MESENQVELRDEKVYPDDEVLSAVLGKSYGVYEALLGLFNKNELEREWRYYKDGKAWLCKVQRKKKTIVWLSAWTGFMQAVIYVPERLVPNMLELNIGDATKEKILKTKNVGKSKPCIFEIRGKGILADFKRIMEFKMKSN